MFGCSKYENLLAQYKAIITDLREQLDRRDALISELTDKLISLSSPVALREVRRTPPPTPAQGSGKQSDKPSRLRWPGYRPNLRPPSPPHPPSAPGSSSKKMSDALRATVMSQVERPDGD